MQKATFRTNLGLGDAKAFGLDFKECQVGMSVEVSDELGEKLAKAGFADVWPGKSEDIVGIEPAPAIAKASESKAIKGDKK